jgi:hypothetical protein
VPKSEEVRCARFAERWDRAMLDRIRRLDEWETPEGVSAFELCTNTQSQFRSDNRDENIATWKPMPNRERYVSDSMETESDVRVNDVADEVFVGTQTSTDAIFIGHVIDSGMRTEPFSSNQNPATNPFLSRKHYSSGFSKVMRSIVGRSIGREDGSSSRTPPHPKNRV